MLSSYESGNLARRMQIGSTTSFFLTDLGLAFKGHDTALGQIMLIQMYTNESKIIHKYNLFPTLMLFTFHTYQKQHQDTLHMQKKKEMHLMIHKKKTLIYSSKCPLSSRTTNRKKSIKMLNKIKSHLFITSWAFEFSYKHH